jgi:FkbM family methyltransferase
MTFSIRRLKAALREPPSDTWKQRAEQRALRIAELEQIVSALQATAGELEERFAASQRRLDARRRTSPRPDILRQVIKVRARHLPVTAADRTAAALRDAHLQQVSAAYAHGLAETSAAGIARIEIDGLPWWVPLDARVSRRVERAEQQGFPLRAILQTREVGLGGVMLDLGANIGRTSIPRVLLGDVRAVYAAEPEPGNYASLVRNVTEHGLRGFVLPDQVAIGAEREDVELRVSRHPGGHRVMHRSRRPVDTITVAVWPVDQWMTRVGVEPESVTFVKVDTQGSEVRVLSGAQSLLARPHVAWQIEIDPLLLKRGGTKLKDLFTLLERHFTHFIDIGAGDRGPRARVMRDLREALAYVGTRERKTDVVVYHA